MSKQISPRFVLSRLPQGSWLTPDQLADAVSHAGVDVRAIDLTSYVRAWRRRGAVVTNRENQVMRPARRPTA